MAVLGDARRLFEDLTALRTFQRKDLVNSTLANVGVSLPAQACIHQQLVDIPQTGRLAVDIVFTVTGAIITAGHHDLVSVISKGPVRIVQNQGRFRKANCCPFLGAAKDHVLHLGATEGFCALLAHNPQNGIGNIGLTGAVGAYDSRDIIAEADQGLVRERLEALYFQTL